MNLDIIPQDSILRRWCSHLSITEIPLSYQIVGGITLIGALLRRQIYIDQVKWKVWPNQPVLFVGPSGCGKDTIINNITREIEKANVIPILGGKTIEAVNSRLRDIGSLAAAYIPAGELSAFFGKKDYQDGMIQDMTDLLSTGDKIDITTKGSLGISGKPTYIYKPTITLHGGTTQEWLHKAMPDGTMEGGFLGRFLIIVEQFSKRHVPLIKYSMTKDESMDADCAYEEWQAGVGELLSHYKKKAVEMNILEEAQAYYGNWYHNRFNYFSKLVLPYANRSRDMVLRLAMLMAASRKHWNWVDEEDMKFGAEMLIEVGRGLENVILPPTNEAQAANLILRMLPATSMEIWKALGNKYSPRILLAAEQLLMNGGRVVRDGNVWKRKD